MQTAHTYIIPLFHTKEIKIIFTGSNEDNHINFYPIEETGNYSDKLDSFLTCSEKDALLLDWKSY